MAKTWYPEHDDALKQHLNSGMSHQQSADALNRQFGTHYSRCACIGRASRQGIISKVTKSAGTAIAMENKKRGNEGRTSTLAAKRVLQPIRRVDPPSPPQQPVIKMRCAAVEPKNLSLTDLNDGVCHWPYGDHNFTFCGHPVVLEGKPYCRAHERLAHPAREAA